MDNAFFCNSGAEANECAIKIARLHGHQRGIENPSIVVMEKAWHGRTLATLSATGSRKAQAGFEPLMGGFLRVPYNDFGAIERLSEHPSVVAILMEVLQGEGGIHVADAEYVRKLREICDRRQWLLMIDEVQSGIGRTGKWFAHQWAGIVPDVMPLAKGLGLGRAHRRVPRARRGRPGVQARQPRHHVRRRPAGVGGGAHDARGDRDATASSPTRRGRARRSCRAWPASSPAWPACGRSAAWAS